MVEKAENFPAPQHSIIQRISWYSESLVVPNTWARKICVISDNIMRQAKYLCKYLCSNCLYSQIQHVFPVRRIAISITQQNYMAPWISIVNILALSLKIYIFCCNDAWTVSASVYLSILAIFGFQNSSTERKTSQYKTTITSYRLSTESFRPKFLCSKFIARKHTGNKLKTFLTLWVFLGNLRFGSGFF